MDRRGVMIGCAAVLTYPPQALTIAPPPAPAGEVVAAYEARLRRNLSDGGGGAFLSGTEGPLLDLHNRFRAEHGCAPLTRSAALDLAARAHVADLLTRGYFAHASPEGFTAEQRVGLLARRLVGATGENIASEDGGRTRPSAADFARLWEKSPGHRANMLRPNYTHVGFGVVAKGARVIAGAVFAEVYAELAKDAPLHVGDGAALAGLLDGASRPLIGYELQPVQGGADLGPFALGAAPSHLPPGAYAVRPHAPDPKVPRRYWILYGPIVLVG